MLARSDTHCDRWSRALDLARARTARVLGLSVVELRELVSAEVEREHAALASDNPARSVALDPQAPAEPTLMAGPLASMLASMVEGDTPERWVRLPSSPNVGHSKL